jgi:hypothetical protein
MSQDTVFDEDMEEIASYVGIESMDEVSTEKQLQFIREYVCFDKYVTSVVEKPQTVTNTFHNPALHVYNKYLEWTDDGWSESCVTQPLRTCQEYILTDYGIQTVGNYSPIVEVGAGNGYLSYVLNANGVSSVATDVNAKLDEYQQDSRPRTDIVIEDGDVIVVDTVWTDVKCMSASEAVSRHRERSVLMCHPPASSRWPEEVLQKLESGDVFIFIGEWGLGCDATPSFFRQLIEEFSLIETFSVYSYTTSSAWGYVFQKL